MRKIASNTSAGDDKYDVRGQVVVVEGGRGCGKSAVLNYATQYATQTGWYYYFIIIIVHRIVSLIDWLWYDGDRLVVSTIGEQFLAERMGMIRKNKTHDGLFDLVYHIPYDQIFVLINDIYVGILW